MKVEEDEFEHTLSAYAAVIWLIVVGGLAFVIKDDPNKKKSKKSKKGKSKGTMDDIMGGWQWFLDSGNKTKLICFAIVGCLLISVLTTDPEELSGPREKSEDEKEFE